MSSLVLREFHESRRAEFGAVEGMEAVRHYGEAEKEYEALGETAGLLDLGFRGRLCLTGGDRHRFLHGQVTNDVNRLRAGEGCYAALVNAKGKMVSDLNIYRLADEILLDFEPGLCGAIRQRLEKFIIADDVEIADAGEAYGLLSVQGPEAKEVLAGAGWDKDVPARPFDFCVRREGNEGEVYLMNQPRGMGAGFDLFVPRGGLKTMAERLEAAAAARGGRWCGWDALEIRRIEAGIPRFGADMDSTNLPPEAGLEARAVSYSKGCYIGQEVIARIRTYGQVAKALRGLAFSETSGKLPAKGDKLYRGEKEAGMVTSVTWSPKLGARIGLGYVRREENGIGNELEWRGPGGEGRAKVLPIPFERGV